MAVLDLKFRFDALTQEGRPFKGQIEQATIETAVAGLIGKFGYRSQGPALIDGTAYRSASGEVIVDGHFTFKVGYDCVRCLEEAVLDCDRHVDHVLVKQANAPKVADGEDEIMIDDENDDPDVHTYSGDEIDLKDVFREDILLELPMNPVCSADCTAPALPGSDDPAANIDPRWAPLLDLKKRMN